MTELFN